MEERKARAMLQVWAGDDDGVKEYKPRSTRIEPKPQHRVRGKTSLAEMVNDFIRRNLIAILVLTAFALEGWIVAVYTEHKVSREVRQTVEAEMRQGFAEYLDQKEAEKQAASFLTGEASRQAAIDDLTNALAPFIAGYKMDGKVTDQGAHAIGWCPIARILNGNYGGTIQDVLGQERQWEFYSPDHAVRNEDTAIAREIAEDFINGRYPDGFTADLVFAERTKDGNVVLRDEFKTGSTTTFWRYPAS